MKTAVLFDSLTPYHSARLRAASRLSNTLAIQARHFPNSPPASSADPPAFPCITLQASPHPARPLGLTQSLFACLDRFRPDCVFVPGWASRLALSALLWCRRRRVPAVLMSESTQADLPRSPIKEWFKRRILPSFSAALVGGAPQNAYLRHLGFPPYRIFTGYDAVDNDHFKRGAETVRRNHPAHRHALHVPNRFFLAAARFVPSKNLPFLLHEYAAYFHASYSSNPCSLVILGDGPLRPALQSLVQALRLQHHVSMPGFIQYPDLPAYYSLAEAFVHPSSSEPWGLVVNEAMASALPVLVSHRCGCVPDLLQPNLNGFSFDPSRPGALAPLLLSLSNSESLRHRLGRAGASLISHWGPDRFASGFLNAASTALAVGPPKLSAFLPLAHHLARA